MNQVNFLIDLLYKALKNTDNYVRKQAETKLLQMCHQDTPRLFQTCGQVIQTQHENQFISVAALTVISRAVSLRGSQQLLWDKLSPLSKEKLKNTLIGTLINNNSQIMRAGAHAISCVVSIQLPRNEWIVLVDTLAQNSTHSDSAIRSASIITIGFICEQLKSINARVDLRCCQNFLGAIIYGLRNKQQQKILKTSLIALRNSLQFVAQVLTKSSNVRNQVFNILIGCLKQQIFHQQVYEALFQFSKYLYDYLGEYLGQLMNFIVPHLGLRNFNTVLALELIDAIGTEYLLRISDRDSRIGQTNHSFPQIINHLQIIQHLLLPQVMRCFLIENPSDLQFSEMRNAADKTLGTIVASGSQKTIDSIINGVATVVRSTNPGEQQAGAPLMSTLCQYQNKQAAAKYINDGIQPVVQLLNSSQIIVISNTLSGFATIAESYPQLFFNRGSIGEIVSKFLQLFHGYSKNLVITYAILDFFNNLSEGFNNQQENLLLSDPRIMMTSIVSQFQLVLDHYYGENIQKAQKIALTIMNFLRNIKNEQTIIHMVEFLIDKFQIFIKKPKNEESQRVLKYILCILQTALFSLWRKKPHLALLDRICHILDIYIEQYGIQEEGINLIGALSIAFGKSFRDRAKFYMKYIFDGIMMVNQPPIFQAALSSLGDFSRNYMYDFKEQNVRALRILFDLINQNIERGLKVKIIQSIGDIFIGLGIHAQQFIEDILKIFNLCFQAVYQLQEIPSERQYVEELKITLIETYASVMFSLFAQFSTSNANRFKFQLFADHYPVMLQFIKKTCNRRFNPTVEYVKNCLTLISDASAFLMQYQKKKAMVIQEMDSPEIKDLVAALDKFSIRDDVKQLQYVIRSQIS